MELKEASAKYLLAEKQLVPAGYKHTEIGVIPEDWVVNSLKELNLDISDGNYSSKYPKSSDFRFIGVPFIRANNVRTMQIVDDDLRFISETQHSELLKGHLKRNDILVTTRGEIGQIAFVPDRHIGSNINAQLVRINVNEINFDYRYFGYSLAFDSSQKQFEDLQTGSALKQLPVGRLISLKISYPPTKAEQEAIAEALSNADALIEALEQLIAKKRQLKQGAMQELLTGKRRLPGFSGEWEAKPLGDIGESIIGLTYSPNDVKADGVLVLRSSNVQEGKLSFEDNVFVEMEIPEKIMVRTGDILICVRNGSRDLIGKCATVDDRCKGMAFGAFMSVFRTPFHSFVFHQFQSDVIKRQINEHLGATINQITNKSLNSFHIPFPKDETEQTAIAQILTDMDAEIAELETKIAKARAVKQGMMQQLLTGRIRLV